MKYEIILEKKPENNEIIIPIGDEVKCIKCGFLLGGRGERAHALYYGSSEQNDEWEELVGPCCSEWPNCSPDSDDPTYTTGAAFHGPMSSVLDVEDSKLPSGLTVEVDVEVKDREITITILKEDLDKMKVPIILEDDFDWATRLIQYLRNKYRWSASSTSSTEEGTQL